MKNQFLTTLIRIVSIGLFFLIVVLPYGVFAQIEEPEEVIEKMNPIVANLVGLSFKDNYLVSVHLVKTPTQSTEIQ